MASTQEFDPAKGYVALPCDVMDIEMSPGAFRLLVELCRMANREGECWPSLGQLSARIGRSKAALSGYVSELRALELLKTASQTMANGYNYRLKYRVTFWQAWRTQISTPRPVKAVQRDECSVQPIERRVNSKNQNQEKQTSHTSSLTGKDTRKLVSIFSSWTKLAQSATFPHFNDTVPSKLLSQTKSILSRTEIVPLDQTQIKHRMSLLWNDLGVSLNLEDIKYQTSKLWKLQMSDKGMQSFEFLVREKWQRHWKRPPAAHYFDEMLQQSQKSNRDEGMLRVLHQYLRRWELSQNKLQRPVTSLSLALKQAA